MIETTETLLVITNYAELDASDVYVDPETRKRWGVIASPVPFFDLNTNATVYCLPLGWEEELTKDGIPFTTQEIRYEVEEI